MPTTCRITFDNNPQKVCYSGTLLQGSVFLNLTSDKSVRGIFIKIKGNAYCHWSEGSGKNKRSYTGEEDYLDERTYFVGPGTNGGVRVEPGSYTYTFQCFLPPNLPTSMEGSYGHIRYSACVVFDIPMWPDKEFDEPFTVIKPIDLNTIPPLREPHIQVKNKDFYPCCLLCCCTSDPLLLTVRMPVGGYTPGQTINLDIEAKNDSDQDVEGFTAQLFKHITYHIYAGSSRQKNEAVLICENESHGGCFQTRTEMYRINLEVPPIPPTDDTTSNICKVRYYVRVYGSVACCHSDPTIEMPIVIGSIPIFDAGETSFPTAPDNTVPSYNSVITNQPVAPPASNAMDPLLPAGQMPPLPLMPALPYPPANGTIAPSAPNAAHPQSHMPSAPNFGDIDPPTYEEATSTRNADADTNDKTAKTFNPKYPMFRRNTSYSLSNN